MAKLRIYELAKELGMENKALLDLCVELGIDGKSSHSNTLSDDEGEKLRRAVIRRAVDGKSAASREVERSDGMFTEKRIGGNVIRRRKKAEEETSAHQESDQVIDISDAPAASINFDKQTPDLQGEKEKRDEALRRANALFKDSKSEENSPFKESSAESDLVENEELAESESLEIDLPADRDDVELVDDHAPRLAQVRQRHDIRAPKVLGKINLPVSSLEKDKSGKKPDEKETGLKRVKKKDLRLKDKKGKTSDIDDDQGPQKRKRRVILEKDELLNFEEEHDSWRGHKSKKKKKDKEAGGSDAKGSEVGETKASKKVVKMQEEITVGELAHQLSTKGGEVIKKLMTLGTMASINQMIDFDTASLIAGEFGFTTQRVGYDEDEVVANIKTIDDPSKLTLRPPVVTVMGHVDHGKTSLLDAIRNTAVTEKEVGGITQHIGAYTVNTASGGQVTFIDTPGHAAFTEMRGRGARVTDIVVLVVAADDGIMPQTIEAINHAKAANVPIIVAINKMDKTDANPDQVKQQLTEYELVPEEWGGTTICCPVSAKTRDGLPSLLENLALQAEVLELKANPERRAIGAVIESRVEKGRGPIMTVLVQNGTLNKGDIFVAGATWGKVRAMVSFDGKQITSAGPSIPVEVLGVDTAPLAGEEVLVVESESEARNIADMRAQRLRTRELAQKGGLRTAGPLTLDSFSQYTTNADKKEICLIVKADVQGSVEVVSSALENLSNDEVNVRVIHKAVGAVNENDVQLALASRATIIAFNIRADSHASAMIEKDSIEIRYSRIIYELVENIQNAIKGLKEPVLKEKILGRVEVRDTFKLPKIGLIAGSYVLDGVVQRGSSVRLLRDNKIVFEGKMASLRRFKDDVKEVASGYECGIGLDGYSDIKPGDVIEVYIIEQILAV
ncbi:MAG: translation initiation factor IF-2 [Deltaproteobacteria bacterium]|nr:translation initiation factor IF-2 [Deltaproteobacteria bacterium]